MRISGIILAGVAGLSMSLAATPSPAQNILKSEPFILAPYEMVLVQDGSCSAGKVMRVTGAIRGLRRKKSCILLGDTQASATLGVLQ